MTAKLSEEKMEECKEMFRLFDKNGDGTISSQELRTVLIALGANPTDSELEEMIKEVDTDNSGIIEFNEFVDIFQKQLEDLDSEQDLIEAFKYFDKDGSGFIDTKEFHDVMTTMGQKLSKEEADAMVKEADIDGNGTINYQEFARLLLN